MTPTRLVGRDAECRRLDALLAAADGRGSVLVVRGEPGIGKSALLAHAADRAAWRHMVVLSAAGVEAESSLPYAGLHQLLQPLLGRLDDLAAPQASALRVAFGLEPGEPPSPFIVALAALQLLGDAAAGRPVLAIAEDAHWLDRSSAEVLAFAGRRIDHEPVVLLIATRDADGEALGHADLPELRLEPLDERSAAELLDEQPAPLAPAARTRVLREAAGNPLALVELPIAWASHPDDVAAWDAMPLTARLERAFASRAARLPAATRRAVLVAALDVGGALHEVLAAAAELEAEPMVPAGALAPAVDAGLLSIERGSVRFRHPLMRSAVQRAAGAPELHAAHAALASVLAHDPARQVWHRAASCLGPDERIAAALEQAAGRSRERGSIAAAVDALERAARLTPAPARRGARLLEAAQLAIDLGRPERTRRLVADASALDLDRRDRARLLWLREELDPDSWSGAERVRAFAERARELAGAGERELALRRLLDVALRLWWSNPDEATRASVVDVAEGVGAADDDPALLAILAFADPLGRGGTVLERVRRLRPEDLSGPTEMHLVGMAADALWAEDEALRFLTGAAEGLRAQGRLGLLAQALTSEAWSAIHLAQGARAAAAADEAQRLAHDTGQPRWEMAAQMALATLAGERGDEATAEALADEAEAAFLAARAHPMLALVQFARGRAAVAHQRYEAGFAQLRRILDPDDVAYNRNVGAWALSDLVEAATHLGLHDEAAHYLARLETYAAAVPGSLLRAQLEYARPLVAQEDEAAALYEAALRGELVNWPCYRGRLLLGYGRWLRRQRRIAESRAPLRAAREAFDALSFGALAAVARTELRASGETSRIRVAHVRDELSPQELQIAQLAAQGLSNKEIGHRLFLSHRTVGSHLYRVYPKLGVTSRVELRDALASGATGRADGMLRMTASLD